MKAATMRKKDAQTLALMPERIVAAALEIVGAKSLFSVCLAPRMCRPLIRLAPDRVSSVPILMYHRIAADGPVALERFRVAPELFALQMATLHRAGYRTIGLGDWIRAMARHKPLLGKPVILTFDDGYRDFLTAAMPTLRVHGFSATVFLVADRIGGTAHWDSGYGEPARLLSWEEVRALQEAGIEMGCHSSLHRPMTGMAGRNWLRTRCGLVRFWKKDSQPPSRLSPIPMARRTNLSAASSRVWVSEPR
jgi:Predicted xylanase/chitin deacetylase